MFLSFFIITSKAIQFNKPDFQELDEDNFGNLDARYQRHIDNSYFPQNENGKVVVQENKNRIENEFFLCSIVITGSSVFNKNWAFGNGLASANGGAGGALFISFCSLSMKDEGKEEVQEGTNVYNFESNHASVGGGIAALYSNVLLEGIYFEGNTAYKYAGALYLQGYEEENEGKRALLYWQNKMLYFENNIAHSIGGAVVATAGFELYFEQTTFEGNNAGISGGALYIINTETKIFQSNFKQNQVIKSIQVSSENINIYAPAILKRLENKNTEVKIDINFAGRGGGAIYFMSDNHYRVSKKEISSNLRLLYTQQCCFTGNSVEKGSSYPNGNEQVNSPGHIIMFNGLCKWHSANDLVGQDDKSIGHVQNMWQQSQLWKQFFDSYETISKATSEMQGICKDGTLNIINEKPYDFILPAAAGGADIGPQKIKAPTEFVYEATPVTELPYATTSSWIEYSPSTEIDVKFEKSRTIKSTLIQTLWDTPFQTLWNTPFQTLWDTPFNTLKTTPKSSGLTPDPTEYEPTPEATAIVSKISYVTETEYMSISISHTVIDGQDVEYSITVPTYGLSNVVTETLISADQMEKADEAETGEEKDNMMIIIIAAVVSGVILIIIIALLVWFFVGYSKSSSSSDSVVEMDEETVLHVPDSTSAPITNDNPLWTTSVMGDTDDPFRNDFEEVAAEGFFNERAETVDSDP